MWTRAPLQPILRPLPPRLAVNPPRPVLTAALLFALPSSSLAQALPTSPATFHPKPIGSSSAATGAASSPTPPALRQVSYLTLSPLRSWISRDGKTLLGKLIAWEDAIGPAPPPLTGPPTALKQNKARLLIDKKTFEIPLDRLSPADQKFIQDLQARLDAKP